MDALAEDEKQRTDFLKACLLKLGLKVNQENTAVPSLSRLHLSSVLPGGTSKMMADLQEIITIVDGEEYIKDDNDTFHLEKPSAWSLGSIADALPAVSSEKTDEGGDAEDRDIDYNAVVKRLVVHDKEPPQSKETPYFNHDSFFANLEHYETRTKGCGDNIGKSFMYGEVVTSTNTILEKYDLILFGQPKIDTLINLGILKCFDDYRLGSQPQPRFRSLAGAAAQTYGYRLLAP